jgi:hypothetical protein
VRGKPRYNWTRWEVLGLFVLPLLMLGGFAAGSFLRLPLWGEIVLYGASVLAGIGFVACTQVMTPTLPYTPDDCEEDEPTTETADESE